MTIAVMYPIQTIFFVVLLLELLVVCQNIEVEKYQDSEDAWSLSIRCSRC